MAEVEQNFCLVNLWCRNGGTLTVHHRKGWWNKAPLNINPIYKRVFDFEVNLQRRTMFEGRIFQHASIHPKRINDSAPLVRLFELVMTFFTFVERRKFKVLVVWVFKKFREESRTPLLFLVLRGRGCKYCFDLFIDKSIKKVFCHHLEGLSGLDAWIQKVEDLKSPEWLHWIRVLKIYQIGCAWSDIGNLNLKQILEQLII